MNAFLNKVLVFRTGCHIVCFSSEEPSFDYVVTGASASLSKYLGKIAENDLVGFYK